ncbi:MAG: LD-carboxypeptidase, partial [Chlorobi bacterium]|nr:LD-carboxypeptidase [Chlorobiota bacterium]
AGMVADPAVIRRGEDFLRQAGWEVYTHPQVYARLGSLAGPDEWRLQALQQALDDPDCRLIWAVRGGYGSIRLIDRLDWTAFARHPKWLAGFSDITVLHTELHRRGFQSLHTWMPINLNDDQPQEVREAFLNILQGRPASVHFAGDSQNLRSREVQGILTGGNLATLVSMAGRPGLDFRGKILFVEDVGEHLYAVDRLFRSLHTAGLLKDLAALVIGHFTDIRHDDPPFPYSVKQIVRQVTAHENYPVFFGFPAGHESINYPLILGRTYRMQQKGDEWILKTVEPENELSGS